MRDRAERDRLYRQADRAWGFEPQRIKAAEEFAELAAVINRAQNGQASREDILGELADARLMLEQLELQYTTTEVDEAVEQALADLEHRLEVTTDA